MLKRFRETMIDCYAEILNDMNPFYTKDGYLQEAEKIIDGFFTVEDKSKYSAADIIQPVFKETRGKYLDVTNCSMAVDMLLDVFKSCEECIPFFEDPQLGPRMEDGNITPVIRVNEHFVLDCLFIKKQGLVYINEKFYIKMPKKRVLDFYKSVLTDDTVYVEYDIPKKSLSSYFKSHFKAVSKDKYLPSKVKSKDRVVKVFDKNGLIEVK